LEEAKRAKKFLCLHLEGGERIEGVDGGLEGDEPHRRSFDAFGAFGD
jgi:hypothetical protein